VVGRAVIFAVHVACHQQHHSNWLQPMYALTTVEPDQPLPLHHNRNGFELALGMRATE